jgi:pimeloyl-ACP methyl ester carboxylesterase
MPGPKPDTATGPARITEYERAGLVFDVIDRGPLDGEVVVLLHGFPQRATCWDGVAARLNEAGYRTLAPDQRGYSPRARPTRRRDYRLTELVADVGALIDTAGRDVHVVGHDWGAAVAWPLAASHPAVRSLTSVSVPHPAAYLLSTLSPAQAVRSWYIGFFQLPFLPERSARSGLLERQLGATGMTEPELEAFRRGILEDGALPGGLAWYRAIPLTALGGPGLWRQKVQVPVTHVWSDEDGALARRTADLAHRWAGGEFALRVLQGHSHWLPEQAPDLLADIVLSRVRSSAAAAGPAQTGHQSS